MKGFVNFLQKIVLQINRPQGQVVGHFSLLAQSIGTTQVFPIGFCMALGRNGQVLRYETLDRGLCIMGPCGGTKRYSDLVIQESNIASLVSQVPSVTGGRQCDFKGCLEEQPNTAQAGLSPRAAIESSDGDQVSGFVPASGKQSRLQDQDPVVLRTDPSDQKSKFGFSAAFRPDLSWA